MLTPPHLNWKEGSGKAKNSKTVDVLLTLVYCAPHNKDRSCKRRQQIKGRVSFTFRSLSSREMGYCTHRWAPESVQTLRGKERYLLRIRNEQIFTCSQPSSYGEWGRTDTLPPNSPPPIIICNLSNDRSKASSKTIPPLVRSRASSFNWQYPLLSLRSSSSFLRLLPLHVWKSNSMKMYVSSSSSVICQTTGPKPLPKRFLHIVRSRASSFNWQYPLLSLRSSSSFLHFLVTSICPFIFPSIICFTRQFLCKMWPIQLAFGFLISCRIFLCSVNEQRNIYQDKI